MPAAWSRQMKVIRLSAVHTNLPIFRFGTFESVHITNISSSQSSETGTCCWFGVGRSFRQAGISDQMMFWQNSLPERSFGIWWGFQCAVLHTQATMADRRAMTATPEKMSRICSNDCLESMEKNEIRRLFQTQDDSQNKGGQEIPNTELRPSASLLDWPLIPIWRQKEHGAQRGPWLSQTASWT